MASFNELLEKLNADLKNLAAAIRAKTGKEDNLDLTEMAAEQDAVFDAGKKAEYDAFWDVYQNYGDLVRLDNAFAEGTGGTRWVYGSTYHPKYPLKPISAQSMYYATRLPYEVLKEVDFSSCTEFYNTFAYSTTERLGVIDMRKATRTTNAFVGCSKLHTIDKVMASENTHWHTNTFGQCSALRNLLIEGTIGTNGFSVSDCKDLTHDSLMSILYALETKTSGIWIVTIGPENMAKLTDAEKAIATQKGWTLG